MLNKRAVFINVSGITAFRVSVAVVKRNASLLMSSSRCVMLSSVGSLREQQGGCNKVAMFGR